MDNYQIDDIVNDLAGSRKLYVALLIILIIFVLLSFGFIYYPIYLMKQKVQTVSTQSADALKSLKEVTTEGQTTLNGLNAGAQEISTINSAINSFVALACQTSPFNNDSFCQNLK